MNNWGLNNTYDYFEFAIDSLDNSGSGSGGVSALNWPSFFVGGKNPLSRVKGMKYYAYTNKLEYFLQKSLFRTMCLLLTIIRLKSRLLLVARGLVWQFLSVTIQKIQSHQF